MGRLKDPSGSDAFCLQGARLQLLGVVGFGFGLLGTVHGCEDCIANFCMPARVGARGLRMRSPTNSAISNPAAQ